MNKQMKKIISVLLSVLMVSSVFAVAVYAAPAEDAGNAESSETVETFKVTFKVNGEVHNEQTVEKGKTAKSPTNPKNYFDKEKHYTFEGWDKGYANITEDTVINAKFTADDHIFTVTRVEPTCSTEGYILHSCTCGYEYKDTLGYSEHTKGEPVRENEVTATCSKEGSYDNVIYCTECGKELSRETVTIEKLAHTPAAPVKELQNEATCTGNAVYKEIVYCSVCGEKLSEKFKIEPALGHDWSDWTVTTPATPARKGIRTRVCARCGEKETEEFEFMPDERLEIVALDTYKGGRILDVQAKYMPSGSTAGNVTWSSDKTNVIAVSSTGNLIGTGVGTATVTVTDGVETVSKQISIKNSNDLRPVRFVGVGKMHYVVEDFYSVYDTKTFYWNEASDLRFKVYDYQNFGTECIVYVNDEEAQRDSEGYWIVPAGSDYVTVTVSHGGHTDDGETVSIFGVIVSIFKKIIEFFKSLFK